MKKFLSHPLVGIVAAALGGILMFSYKDDYVVMTLVGLVLLMWGLYKTSKLSGSRPEENQTPEKNNDDAL